MQAGAIVPAIVKGPGMAQTIGPGGEGSGAPARGRARMIAAATIGNALEFYDFVIYGFFASAIAGAFFPGRDLTTRLLLTFGTFGVSFLMRPVGALVLGAYADRKGRRACMTLSISLTTLAGAIIALMPDRAAIGLAAPVGVLAARLIQGFALGGEFGSATALMIEHSNGGEARAASWQATSQYFASLIASAVAWLLGQTSTMALLHVQGFRVAFALGVLAGPVALLLRRRLHEGPSFTAQARQRVAHDAGTPGAIAIAAGMVAIGTAQTYLIVYLPTYATRQLHMQAGSALGSVMVSYAAILALTPLRLAVAQWFDRSRRGTAMILSCVAMLAAGYPGFMLLGAWPNPIVLFLLPVAFTLIGMPYTAPLYGFMGMIFSVRQRGFGLSVGYALGITVFGGFAPFINVWLIARTGDARSPGLYLALTAIVTIAALVAAQRRLPRAATPS